MSRKPKRTDTRTFEDGTKTKQECIEYLHKTKKERIKILEELK